MENPFQMQLSSLLEPQIPICAVWTRCFTSAARRHPNIVRLHKRPVINIA